MATTHPLPPPVSAPSPTHVAAGAAAKEAAGPAQQALVPCPHPPAEEQGMELTAPVARLPVELDAVSYTHLDVYKRQPLRRPWQRVHFARYTMAPGPA